MCGTSLPYVPHTITFTQSEMRAIRPPKNESVIDILDMLDCSGGLDLSVTKILKEKTRRQNNKKKLLLLI